MSKRPKDDERGFTLIEVLATVVILSLFAVTLLSLMGQMLLQMKLTDQKQQALTLARAELGQMAVQGAASVVNGPQPPTQTLNGVSYTITPSLPPPNKVPQWAKGLVYAEVKVTWNTLQAGQTTAQSVTLDQVFQK